MRLALVASAGHSLAFAIRVALWLTGLASGRWALLISGDPVFAALFTGGLLNTRETPTRAAP